MASPAEEVKKIIVDQLGVSPDQVTDEAKFIEDLGADSLDQVELIMSVEKEFDVNVPDETLWELIDTMDEQVLSGIVCRLLGVE